MDANWKIDAGEITLDQADQRHAHEVNTIIAQNLGIKYTQERIDA